MNHSSGSAPGICAEVESSLPLYVGGDLEAEAMAATTAHLADCRACAAAARAAGEARDLLVSALRLKGTRGPDLWAGVRAVLADERRILDTAPESVAPVAPVARAVHGGQRRWVAWASAAAAAVLLGFWLGRQALEHDAPGRQAVDRPALDALAGGYAPSRAVPTLPVGGLRRLGRDEEPLRTNAEIFYEERNLGGFPLDPNSGAPVGLRLVRTTQ